MGCHTWFYNEWKHISEEDIKSLIKKYDEDYKIWKKETGEEDLYKRIHSPKISRHKLVGMLRRLDWNYPDKYYDVPGYGDNFRIYDYDAEPWYSVEDFEKYIEQNPNIEVTYNRIEGDKWVKIPNGIEYAKNIMREFFERYPHGKIELG